MRSWHRQTGQVIFGALLGAFLALPVRAAEQPEWLAPLPPDVHLELPSLRPDIPAPGSVLGAPLGTRFSRWDEAREYLETLAAASDRVTLRRYGETYEGRPLMVAAITSVANQERLDRIRRDRLRLADPRGLSPDQRRRLERDTPVVVWLGYGIHGNETSSTEAALAAAYVLAAAEGDGWEERLGRVVVLVDPLQNPDGRARYLAAYQQRRGREADPSPDAAEHHEPWPGGRGNHYLFDLNRDWAWATQVETRHRLTEYRRWEPQVFVDLHEMSARSEYFFPPPTEPVHPAVSPSVLRWLDRFGRANAAAFDRAGWLYFKAEAFDLFYPGYGDSYPSLRGAVGMTFEVGGGGRAGEALALDDGSLLTLANRLARHLTSSLATVAAAADGQAELNRDFAVTRTPAGTLPATYLWPAGRPEARALVDLLRLHGIEVARLGQATTLDASELGGRAERRPTRFAAGSWAVSTVQPLGRLVRALLEAEPELPGAWVARQRERAEQNLDDEFFDVTAWGLPLAFGLDAWVHAGVPPGLETVRGETGPAAGERAWSADDRSAGEPVGWVLPWQGIAGYRVAGRLLGSGAPLRLALGTVETADSTVGAGSLFVPRRGAPDDLEELVARAGGPGAVASLRPVRDSYGEVGTSLGSDRVVRLHPPRIGLLGGPGVDTTSFGSLWWLLDRLVEVPAARLEITDFGRRELLGLDVLVLPDGDYGALGGGGQRSGDQGGDDQATVPAELAGWVRDGGILVAVGEARRWLVAIGLSAVEAWPQEDDDAPSPAAGEPRSSYEPERLSSAGGDPSARERRLLHIPGAIVATRLSPGHPLAAGLPAPPPVLFRGDSFWRPTGDPQQDVLTGREIDPVTAGFTWPEGREHLAGSLLVASERVGGGRVVLFAQEPAFRGFWRATMPLLLDAVLYGPSHGLDPAAGGG